MRLHTTPNLLWSAANGGVTNGGLRGVWPSILEIGRNRPFSPFFALFRRARRAPGKSRKRRKKAFFLRYPQICLNPHLLNPHLRHSNFFFSLFCSLSPGSGRQSQDRHLGGVASTFELSQCWRCKGGLPEPRRGFWVTSSSLSPKMSVSQNGSVHVHIIEIVFFFGHFSYKNEEKKPAARSGRKSGCSNI